ncbi:hypothetical protein [Vibrio phage vB_VibM_83AMN]|nr:hypothetical protein [Vibrio phage vB_VibM_83AMN]
MTAKFSLKRLQPLSRKPTAFKGRKINVKLSGGPFDGETVAMHSNGTLAFSVPSYNNGERGYYNHSNSWCKL